MKQQAKEITLVTPNHPNPKRENKKELASSEMLLGELLNHRSGGSKISPHSLALPKEPMDG
jgi:hypothetical protein